MYYTIIKVGILVFSMTFLWSICTFAQSKTDDCIIYEKILLYLNKIEENNKYFYKGEMNPETGYMGERFERQGFYQYSFYIVDKRSAFGHLLVKHWFSKLLDDSTIIQKKYKVGSDSVMNCIFRDDLEYQYKPLREIYFSDQDFLLGEKNGIEVHYTPIGVTFSKILYTKDNRALVFAKIYIGTGAYRNIYTFGFVYKRSNNNWILAISKGEMAW